MGKVIIFLLAIALVACTVSRKDSSFLEGREACRKANKALFNNEKQEDFFHPGHWEDHPSSSHRCLQEAENCPMVFNFYNQKGYPRCGAKWLDYGCEKGNSDSCELLKAYWKKVESVASSYYGELNVSSMDVRPPTGPKEVTYHNCLPQSQKYILNDSNYIVLTVKHPSYEEAEKYLMTKLSSSGFHQNIKAEEVKKFTSYSYTENKKIETTLDANVDHWIKYSCNYKGDYYITAVIGKEGISYVKMKPPKSVNLKEIKKFCKGYDKIMLAAGRDSVRFSAEKQMKIREKYGRAYSDYTNWYIGCGRASVYSIYKRQRVFNNELESFVYYNEYKGGKFSNETKETIGMWLELTKSIE